MELHSVPEIKPELVSAPALSAAAAMFTRDEIILYDLACVCCVLNCFDEARTWLGKAIEAGGNNIKLKALDERDLEPLWK